MKAFLRRVRKGKWDRDAPPLRHRDDFIRRPGDTDGLSLFEVESSDPQTWTDVVAAIALDGRDDRRIDLLRIDEDDLQSFTSPAPSQGGCCVESVNQAHRALDWEQAHLHDLADHLRRVGRQPLSFSTPKIRAVLLSFDTARITDPDAVGWLAACRPKWSAAPPQA